MDLAKNLLSAGAILSIVDSDQEGRAKLLAGKMVESIKDGEEMVVVIAAAAMATVAIVESANEDMQLIKADTGGELQ